MRFGRSRNPATAALPTMVEVMAGDFTEPGSLDPALRGVRAVFLLWTAPLAAAAAVVDRLAPDPRRVVGHAGGDYVLTGPESLSQAEQVSMIGDVLGHQIRFDELSPDEFRRETAGTWPGPVVEMLLAAWGATIGHPAFVTSTVADVAGAPARTFRQWVSDHAGAFRKPRRSSPVEPVTEEDF